MTHIFRNFIDSLMCSPDVVALQTTMEEISPALGLETFAYLFKERAPSAQVKLISNYPVAWTSHYLASHYEQLDPVILQVANSSEPFQWGNEYREFQLTPMQRQFMDEAAYFGIQSGFTIPIHDATSQIAAVTFTSGECQRRFRRSIEAHRSLLQFLAVLFHTRAWRKLATCQTIGGVRLSPREYECLEWASRGKSAQDIASILHISRRTAVFHLENAKARLGVRSTAQAIALLADSR